LPGSAGGASLDFKYTNKRLGFRNEPSQGTTNVIGSILVQTPTTTTTPPATTEIPTPAPAPAVFSAESQDRTAEMVKTHRNNLVFVSGSDGAEILAYALP
jgi:hypothetical protein